MSAELEYSIGILSNLLQIITGISLNPGFILRSKSNKLIDLEVKCFWDILHGLCCFSTSKKCTNDAYNCIKKYLMEFDGLVLYHLPCEASARQLLLCLGGLMSIGVINNIVDKFIVETPIIKKDKLKVLQFGSSESSTSIIEKDSKSFHPSDVFILLRKIQSNLKAIRHYQQEIARLFFKIHKTTQDFHGLPFLSASDIHLLKNYKHNAQFALECQTCLLVLEVHAKWKKNNSIFWKWMDLILEEEFEVMSKPTTKTNLNIFLKEMEINITRRQQSTLLESLSNNIPIIHYYYHKKDVSFPVIKILESKINWLIYKNEKSKQELSVKLSSKKNEDYHFLIDLLNQTFYNVKNIKLK